LENLYQNRLPAAVNPAKTPVDLKTAERIAERVALGLSYQEAGGAGRVRAPSVGPDITHTTDIPIAQTL
jgi:hypothetical protein